jgi:hypothetical protein
VASQSVIHSVEQSKSTVLSFPVPAPEPVTQLELATLLSLRNRARQISEHVADAEASIRVRLELHAAVETGEHTAELKESSRRSALGAQSRSVSRTICSARGRVMGIASEFSAPHVRLPRSLS